MCKKWIKNTILYIRLIEWGAIRQIHFEILNLKPETHFKQVGTNAAMDWESCRLSANRWYHDLETFFIQFAHEVFLLLLLLPVNLNFVLAPWVPEFPDVLFQYLSACYLSACLVFCFPVLSPLTSVNLWKHSVAEGNVEMITLWGKRLFSDRFMVWRHS